MIIDALIAILVWLVIFASTIIYLVLSGSYSIFVVVTITAWSLVPILGILAFAAVSNSDRNKLLRLIVVLANIILLASIIYSMQQVKRDKTSSYFYILIYLAYSAVILTPTLIISIIIKPTKKNDLDQKKVKRGSTTKA